MFCVTKSLWNFHLVDTAKGSHKPRARGKGQGVRGNDRPVDRHQQGCLQKEICTVYSIPYVIVIANYTCVTFTAKTALKISIKVSPFFGVLL